VWIKEFKRKRKQRLQWFVRRLVEGRMLRKVEELEVIGKRKKN